MQIVLVQSFCPVITQISVGFLLKTFHQCVVPENICTPTTEGIGNYEGEGGGGVKDPGNFRGRGFV